MFTTTCGTAPGPLAAKLKLLAEVVKEKLLPGFLYGLEEALELECRNLREQKKSVL